MTGPGQARPPEIGARPTGLRILLVSQFFEPEPTLKGLQLARALTQRGHTVEVLTGFPNYPGGRLYPGYRLRPWRRATVEGITVTRVWLMPSHDRSPWRRAANYLSFATTATLAALVLPRPDVVYAYHPPATAVLPAVALRSLRGVPYVMDVQDLWPDTLGATGMLSPGLALRAIGALVALTYRRASRIIAQSPGFRTAMRSRGVPEAKLALIHNWTDEAAFGGVRAPAATGRPGLNVLFAGTMGAAQALDAVLEAAARARSVLPHVTFTFIGGGTERARLETEATERGLSNVRFLPRRDASEMPAVFADADVLLVHLRDDPLFRITIPSKTQAYLAVGRPILMAMDGDAAQLVERAGAGVRCAPEDPDALLKALRQLDALTPAERAAMGARGRAFYQRELSLDAGVERVEVLLRAAAAERAPLAR